jgi:hypothetical protein
MIAQPGKRNAKWGIVDSEWTTYYTRIGHTYMWATVSLVRIVPSNVAEIWWAEPFRVVRFGKHNHSQFSYETPFRGFGHPLASLIRL